MLATTFMAAIGGLNMVRDAKEVGKQRGTKVDWPGSGLLSTVSEDRIHLNAVESIKSMHRNYLWRMNRG